MPVHCALGFLSKAAFGGSVSPATCWRARLRIAHAIQAIVQSSVREQMSTFMSTCSVSPAASGLRRTPVLALP
eukprot:5266699-Alexandrium_andersonii.AAC.1